MQIPPIPADESKRLRALTDLAILDTGREDRFDRITRLAAAYFRVPIALVSLVDAERQWFKSAHGLGIAQTPRSVSFCGHAILGTEALVVSDANQDQRFCDNPLVTGEPGIRFYAGQPIVAPDGYRIGTLCIIDRQPRTLSADERSALRDFGLLVENEIQHARTHRAVEQLRQINADKSTILQTALDCIVTIDSAGEILEFNPAAERTFGYRREDVIGKEMAALIVPPKLREMQRAGMKHYLATGEGPMLGKRIEVPALRADGSEFMTELAITPTRIGDQRAFTAFMRDITAATEGRRRLQAQHRISLLLAEQLDPAAGLAQILQSICETLGWAVGALWTLDEGDASLTYHYGWCTPAMDAGEFVRTSREMRFAKGTGLPGRVWSARAPIWIRDVIQDENFSRAPVAKSAGLHAAIGLPIQAGARLLGVMEFFSPVIREPDEDLLFLLQTIGQQIGQYLERRTADARVQQLTSELNAIFSLSPDGFMSFDARGLRSYANPAVLRMLALDATDEREFDEGMLDQLLRERADPKESVPAVMQSEDGAQVTLRLVQPRPTTLTCTVRRFLTPAHEPLGKVVYFRDITHEAEVDRMKTEFLSAAAHELRTPMASIFGFSELLLKRSYDEATRVELTETIYRQSKQLINLVTELLDLARIEARQGKDFNIGTQDLVALVRETVAGFIVPSDKRKVSVKSPRGSRTILADAEKFKQALLNVLSNAYKYSPAGGRIELTFRERKEGQRTYAGVAVRDHGIGMTPEQLERVFERFYRADSSGAIPGTGLGMSLVKEIMDVHRGMVEVASNPGVGTEVVLWLPRPAEASA